MWRPCLRLGLRHGPGREHAARNSAIRREVLGERRPALTVLIAGTYDPAWLLEIEVVAAVTRPEAGAAAP